MKAKQKRDWGSVAGYILVAIGFGFLTIHGIRVENYHDNKVSGGEMKGLLDFMAMHSSRPRYVKVAGHVYVGVRGVAPFYLDVPSMDSILFVTQNEESHARFHVVNLATREHLEIDGGTTDFGGHIGGKRKPGEPFSDYIESVSSNKITVVERRDDSMQRIVIDLDAKKAKPEAMVKM